MKPPRKGYGKEWAVKWINVGNTETMYSGAMTKEEAMRLVATGNWNKNACPMVERLKKWGV